MLSKSASISALEQALVLSRRMQELAECQEWGPLGELALQRQQVLGRIEGQLPDDQAVRGQLEELLSLNRDLERICTQARDRAAVALRGQKRNDKAIRSYREMGPR